MPMGIFLAEWQYFGHLHWRSDERRGSPMGVRGTLPSTSASRHSLSGVAVLLTNGVSPLKTI